MLYSEIMAVNRQPSNARLQRTRSAPLRSPLSRQPFGDTLKRFLALLGAVGVASTGLAQTGSGDLSFVRKAVIRIERNVRNCAEQQAIAQMNWQPLGASPSQVQTLRRILVAALRQNKAEEEAARRHGQVTAGVPGCVSNDFRLTLEQGEKRDVSVLHLCAGWLAGQELVGSIVFSDRQRQEMIAVLGAGCS